MIAAIPALVGHGRAMRRLLRPLLDHAAAVPGVDRYRKHFSAHAHLLILLVHVLDSSPSLRQTHQKLADRGWARLGLNPALSRSQLARSSTSRPPDAAEELLKLVLAHVRAKAKSARPHAKWLVVVDSTFITLSAKLCGWSQHGGHAAGVRVHTAYDLAAAVPVEVTLGLADTNDIGAFGQRDLTPYRGATLIMDRGYYGHVPFARMLEAQVHFVVRRHAQVTVKVTEERTVSPARTTDGDRIVSDQVVTLGSPNHRDSPQLTRMRLIVSENTKGNRVDLVTDRFDLEADEIAMLYRRRWQIELYFRWIKHQLKITTPLGTSRAAMWLTILIHACVAALLMVIDEARPRHVTKIAWARGISGLLATTFHTRPRGPALQPTGPVTT